MRILLVILTLLPCFAAPLAASDPNYKVLDCDLRAEDDAVNSASITLYVADTAPHSVFLELKTDYGDTLPYVFFCEGTCDMNPTGHDYSYRLVGTPNIAEPEYVALLTTSKTDDFSNRDLFAVAKCKPR